MPELDNRQESQAANERLEFNNPDLSAEDRETLARKAAEAKDERKEVRRDVSELKEARAAQDRVNEILAGEVKVAERGQDALAEHQLKTSEELKAAILDTQDKFTRYLERQVGTKISPAVTTNQAKMERKAEAEGAAMSKPDVQAAERAYADKYLAYWGTTSRDRITLGEVQEAEEAANRAFHTAHGTNGYFLASGEIAPDTYESGGATIPRLIAAEIIKLPERMGGVRELASMRDLSAGRGNSLTFPRQSSYAKAEFAGARTGAIDNTEIAELGGITINLNKAATEVEVDRDSWTDFPMETMSFHAEQLMQGLVDIENKMFVEGNDPKSPKGVLSHTFVDAAKGHVAQSVQRVKTGVAGAWPGSGTVQSKPLSDALAALHSNKVANGGWIVNRSTHGALRVLKDADDRPLWHLNLVAGMPATFYGLPVFEDEWMPDIANNSYSVLLAGYGFYTVLQRASEGVYTIRDMYTKSHFDIVRGFRRCGGDVTDFTKVCAVQFAA